MTRRLTLLILLPLLLVLAAGELSAQNRMPQRPKLVLLVAIDQFRYDYLTRFRGDYTGGLQRLLERGAVFTNAYLEHYPTVTAVGHSTMLSGATPATSGIIGNDWYDRESRKAVTSVSDDETKLLGAPGAAGMSPRRLLVSTIGDEMKRGISRESKAIGLSLKDRSAVLPLGRTADAAYWYDDDTGAFVSSTYYFPELPAWVTAFNAPKPANTYAGKVWLPAADGRPARALPTTVDAKLTAAVYASPYGNELLEQFAETAISAEKLGQRGVTDILTVSFSSNDAVGHS